MNKPLLALIVAATTSCPLVNVAGNYSFDLRTEQASSWSTSSQPGCRKTGSTYWQTKGIKINSDGIMDGQGQSIIWPNDPPRGGYHGSGLFGGRVEPGTEPMQWVASAGDVEMKGTWRKGQLSGEFVQRFIENGKEIECRGKVSGFKKSK
ncbi:hypothetical protein A0J48_018235 [Sphaerospermopsis aphanizomenoides BCCUSP55]|uniref:hypothetical protein n=1 Tax=Sphaerospermopsis aphanizomenoides TaxID=459663 RepID=UPI0019087C2F|nr:hypothetical protein [Sphaerospermopsis aphanizomenoides]MBK1989448.1 hypothetical protein [Sphaerospermopsis aphanizomenoides BCCUSP55]